MTAIEIFHKKIKKKMKSARKIKAETFEGNIEYKWKLCNTDNSEKLNHLITQMKYRLYQGEGYAVYNIGYQDNGFPMGISYQLLYDNLKIFHGMIDELECKLKSVKIFKGKKGYCANIYIEKINNNIYETLIEQFYNFHIN